VCRWAKDVRPRVIFLENVSEFRGWGPLGKDGKPIKARMGETFKRWKARLVRLGYQVDYRILDASQYGAPTRRRRLFLIARCDGQAIQWPTPTHGPGLLPVHTAAECIDWSLPCPSIFARKKPLAEKTLWRIAQGIRRFVFENARPANAPHGKHALVGAFLAKHFGGVVGQQLDLPTSTITAKDHHSLAAVSLATFRGTDPGQPGSASVEQPLPVISAGGIHVAEVRAFLTAFYGQDGGRGKGQRLLDPVRTITAKHRFGLVTIEGAEYQIVDIGMRMLEPHELLRAQFGRFAAGYDLSQAKGKSGKTTKAAQIRLIGNSVCPEIAEAIVAAALA
jgi:DNA (cytosine-5)-methyltransferase 1